MTAILSAFTTVESRWAITCSEKKRGRGTGKEKEQKKKNYQEFRLDNKQD